MTKYLLDTNICIYVINHRPPHVRERLHTFTPEQIFISSVTVAELLFGAQKSSNPAQTRKGMLLFLAPFHILDFTVEDADVFGYIRANLQKKGRLIGPYDMQIAAQAISRDITLVTNNTREFERVQGLRLENWV